MPLEYFADSSLSVSQLVFLYLLTAFIVIGILTGVIVFITARLLRKNTKWKLANNLKLSSSLLLGLTLVAVIILAFIIIPTNIKNSRWEIKQQKCAKQVGYANPGDDNSNSATAESQAAYSKCLGL